MADFRYDDLRGLNAVVVGASRGIGKCIAHALAAEGCNIALLSRSDQTSLARELKTPTPVVPPTHQPTPGAIHTVPCDITSDTSIDAAIASLAEIYAGKIHIVVLNAGILAKREGVIEADWEEWDNVLATNLRGVIRFTKAVAPFVKASGRGCIINIASGAAYKVVKAHSMYSASKAALVHFSRCLFEDLREDNIKVCAICPGFVNTPMLDGFTGDKSKMIQPEDIARTVLFVAKFPQTGCPTEIAIRPQLPVQRP